MFCIIALMSIVTEGLLVLAYILVYPARLIAVLGYLLSAPIQSIFSRLYFFDRIITWLVYLLAAALIKTNGKLQLKQKQRLLIALLIYMILLVLVEQVVGEGLGLTRPLGIAFPSF